MITRRASLLGLTTVVATTRAALAVAPAATDRRFIVVLLRGALDGMAAVVPYGDPALAALRGELLPPDPGQPDGLLDLGGFYGLHPAMPNLHALYQANEMAIVHAVAGPYRVRSHFEAQDYLECGADHRMTSGWLNRVVAAMPADGPHPHGLALALNPTVPLLLRGPAEVANWAPHGFAQPAPDLYAAIATLNAGDPLLGKAIRAGMEARGFGQSVMSGDDKGDRYAFPALAKDAAEWLRAPDGPRIAALEIGGWDTHAAQAGRLRGPLKQLDDGMAALKQGLGPVWQQTVVLVMTEFGRTARINGTKGTDHGTGSVAFVLGGAVAGGRVIADWPGLGPGRLFENRDLAPTTDLRAVAKGLLAAHLRLGTTALGQVFPGSDTVAPTRGLVHA